MNDNDKLDSQVKYQEIIKRYEHGDTYGLRRLYYFCDTCRVGWGNHAPYWIAHFKHNGLWYGVPRPLKGLMPACPECRSRDNVHRLNRYKKS